jgi:hypothetical protein
MQHTVQSNIPSSFLLHSPQAVCCCAYSVKTPPHPKHQQSSHTLKTAWERCRLLLIHTALLQVTSSGLDTLTGKKPTQKPAKPCRSTHTPVVSCTGSWHMQCKQQKGPVCRCPKLQACVPEQAKCTQQVQALERQ